MNLPRLKVYFILKNNAMSKTTKWIFCLCLISWFANDVISIIEYFVPAINQISGLISASINRIALNAALVYSIYKDRSEHK